MADDRAEHGESSDEWTDNSDESTDDDLASKPMSKEEFRKLVARARKTDRLAAKMLEETRFMEEDEGIGEDEGGDGDDDDDENDEERKENPVSVGTPMPDYVRVLHESALAAAEPYLHPDRLFGRWTDMEDRNRCETWPPEDSDDDILQAFLAEAQSVTSIFNALGAIFEVGNPASDAYVSLPQRYLLAHLLCTQGDIDMVWARGKTPPEYLYEKALGSLPDDHRPILRKLLAFVKKIQETNPEWIGP
ncbi:hypothetical protein BOTBODRAFT_187389 [Botryobasidium botryosum FD-172 SS1]|uniref:Uncharacterized protein n=1 Tax=Botryobasidium botryosum (strain FD-172 SS1) TaxID=930990 RepID=A0A067MTU7_BOTB1|nr:hypothetical protein BOTBODRAFT_187389 [Botryobasidium botryosum FD-172 SS1]